MTPREARDLLISLRRAVLRDGLLAWAVAHAPDGDPVPEAWVRCESDSCMVNLLCEADIMFDAPWWCGTSECCNDFTVDCAECAAKLRTIVPTLTLGDVAAARGSKL